MQGTACTTANNSLVICLHSSWFSGFSSEKGHLEISAHHQRSSLSFSYKWSKKISPDFPNRSETTADVHATIFKLAPRKTPHMNSQSLPPEPP